MPVIPQNSQSIQRKPLVSNDTLPSGLKFGRFVLSTNQLCCRLFTKNSDADCLNAVNSLIGLAVEKSKEWNLLCKNFLQSSGTDTIQLRSSGEHGGYSTTAVCDAEGKEIEITFPLDSCGMLKELGEYTAEHEMMHRLVPAMLGSNNSHGVAAAILSEMGVPARNAAPTIDLAQPGSSASERQSPSEVAALLLQPRRGVKRKGDELSNDYVDFTEEHVLECANLLEAAKEKRGIISGYAGEHRLDLEFFERFVNGSGVTKRGMRFIEDQKKKRSTKEMTEHLKIWRDMSEDERQKQGSPADYALKNGLIPDNFSFYADASGLTKYGEQFLAEPIETIRMTVAHLERWRDMSEDEKEEGGIVGYARKEHLHYPSLVSYVNKNGLKERGEKFLERKKRV